MMGRAHRVLLGLGLALLLTLFLCDEVPFTQPPRAPENNSGETRLKLNGEPYEVKLSHLVKGVLKPKQDSNGNFLSSTIKRLVGSSSHSRQRRSIIGKFFPAFKVPSPLREAPPAPTTSTTTTTTTTTPEPTVVTVTEVMITHFGDADEEPTVGGGGRVLISFQQREPAISSAPFVSATDASSAAATSTATTSAFALGASFVLTLSRLFSG